MSHIGQAGNYTELSWEPVVKHARYPLKLRVWGKVEGGKEKNRRQEGGGNVKWARTRRWVKISRPFSEQRPIQLKLDQSTQMCLVSGYCTQHWVARQRQEILLWLQYSLELLIDTNSDIYSWKLWAKTKLSTILWYLLWKWSSPSDVRNYEH